MKDYYFNVKDHDISCIEDLHHYHIDNHDYSACILYPNYNLGYYDFLSFSTAINKNSKAPVNWKITLVENKYFQLENDCSNITNYQRYNNIDIDKLSSISDTFDLIIMTRIVEHLTPEQYMYLLYNLKNIINKNSKVVLTYPDMDVITKQIRNYRNKKRKMRIEDYTLWNIELFNPVGENAYDYHKMYTNPYTIKALSEYESIFTVIDTSDLFAINSNRKCYRRTVLAPLGNN